MSSTQETFVSHLIELRQRVVHALIAFLVVFVFWIGFNPQPLVNRR